jgi:hypothetical protein
MKLKYLIQKCLQFLIPEYQSNANLIFIFPAEFYYGRLSRKYASMHILFRHLDCKYIINTFIN